MSVVFSTFGSNSFSSPRPVISYQFSVDSCQKKIERTASSLQPAVSRKDKDKRLKAVGSWSVRNKRQNIKTINRNQEKTEQNQNTSNTLEFQFAFIAYKKARIHYRIGAFLLLTADACKIFSRCRQTEPHAEAASCSSIFCIGL